MFDQEEPPKRSKKKTGGGKFDEFNVLRGYHIGSDIDRRLLRGMFEQVQEDQKAV